MSGWAWWCWADVGLLGWLAGAVCACLCRPILHATLPTLAGPVASSPHCLCFDAHHAHLLSLTSHSWARACQTVFLRARTSAIKQSLLGDASPLDAVVYGAPFPLAGPQVNRLVCRLMCSGVPLEHVHSRVCLAV